jgi:hypothetical protein
MASLPEEPAPTLWIEPERALFEGTLDALAVACYQNERPPRGLAGILDWYFQGQISAFLASGSLSGRVGECTYLPVQRHGQTFHVLLAGAGSSAPLGKRHTLAPQTLQALKRNLVSLGFKTVGISLADFGTPSVQSLLKPQMKGVSVWITP